MSFSLLVIFLFVVDNSKFWVDEGVWGVDLFSFKKGESGCFEIVCPEVLHSHIEMGLCATREESHYGSIDRHSLIWFVLDGEGVCHSDPCEKETFVENDSFLEIFSSYFVLFTMEIVASNSEPTDWMRGVVFD